MINKELISEQTRSILTQLLKPETWRPGMTLVISCSISRVEGRREDTTGNPDCARAILNTLRLVVPSEINLAVQCCEHLNRSLIVEREVAERYNLEQVTAIPVPQAGGTFAATAFEEYFHDPVLISSIQADLGIDIGLTMIGMHLKPVPKPLLLDTEMIGGARVVAARCRPRLIGGARTHYA
jgi:uncharacterized protein (TIGR01440 family)